MNNKPTLIEIMIPLIVIPEDIDRRHIISLLDNFINGGNEFRDTIIKYKKNKINSNEILSVIGNKIIEDYTPKTKRILRATGRTLLNDSDIHIQKEMEDKTFLWLDLVSHLINHPDLRIFYDNKKIDSWNNDLGKARQMIQLETRINHSIRLLDKIKQTFQTDEKVGFRTPLEESIYLDIKRDNKDIYNILYSAKLLVINGITPDDFSSCLLHCRRLLEGYAKKRGHSNYKEYIRSINIEERRKKPLIEVYNYLSNYGVHFKEGGIKRVDMESGYFQTLNAISILTRI